MAALDTLFFDLKLNDLTDEQMKTIKSRLEKQLGLNLDLGKQIEQSVNKGGGIKVKVGANTEAAEAAIRRMTELLEKGNLSKTEINELNAITKALKSVSSAAEKTKKDVQKVAEETSNVHTIKIDNRDSNVINLLKNNLEVAWQKAIALENELKGIYNSGKNINGDSSLRNYVKRISEELYNARNSVVGLESALSSMSKMNGSVVINDKMSDFGTKKQAAELEQRKRVWKQWAEEQDKADRAASESARKQALAQAELAREQAKAVRQSELENSAMIKLRATIESMELAMRRYEAVSNAMGKPKSIEAAIQKMREYIELARQASANGKDSLAFMRTNQLSMGAGNLEKAVSTEMALERQRQKAMAASQAQERLAASHYKASIATDSHARASFRLGNSLTGLISITGDLRNQVGMLISAYTFEHILKNVVEIGGEFEKQKMAMGSMLGSLEQADDIFNRMKNLALTSPFNFKDLSNYSRQLTAFGTPYKDLYDTTNRLADISAGLGGDMSRLVLAFSQVKAAAYLRGQEMRQFTEFGVSLPDLLAKKYSEAEHRIVTAGDVIERVSKRMVSFNDVKDVLWKSTDKGGQFYGMQDVLAQSTSGMASNLKDAIDTMYYDIANSNSGVIKGTIKDITELVSHWRELGAVVAAGTLVYSGHRLAMGAYNRVIGRGTAETIKGVMAAKAEEASIIRRKALYGEITAQEQMLINTSDRLTASDIKNLAVSKAISADSVMRMVGTRKITAAQATQIASTVELNAAQTAFLVKMRAIDMALTSSNGFTKMNLQMQKLYMSLKSIGGGMWAGIWSGIKGIFSPVNLAMTGAFLGLDMWMNYKQHLKEVQEANDNTVKNAEDGAKTLNQFLKDNPIKINSKSDDIVKQIEQYKNQLESSPVDMASVITNIGTLKDANQQLEEMYKEVKALKDAHDSVASSSVNPFVSAEENTNHWYNDSFSTNLSDMSKAWGELNAQIGRTPSSEINNLLNGLKDSAPKIVESINKMKDASPNEKMLELFRLSYSAGNSAKTFSSVSSNTDGISTAYEKYLDYVNSMITVDTQWVNFSKEITNNLKNNKIDIQNMDQKGVDSVKEWASEYVKSHNLAGEALKIFNLKVENTYFATSKAMKNSTVSWQTMFDTVKSKIKNGDITRASEEETKAAVKASITELRQLYPQMNLYLNWVQKQLDKNPLVITSRLNIMAGGKQDNGWLYNMINGQLPKSQKNNPNLPKSGSTDISAYHSQLKQDYDAAFEKKKLLKAALEKAKKGNGDLIAIQMDYNNAESELNNIVSNSNAAGFTDIVNQTKNSKPKKQKVHKTDEYLKTIQNSYSRLKEVKELFNKFLSDDYGESKSLDAVRRSGMSYASVLDKDIKTKGQFDEEYIKQLNILIHRLSSNKSKLTKERIKELDDLRKERSEVTGSIQKEEFEKQVEYVKYEMDRLSTLWDRYKKLTDAGMSRKDSSMLIFGKDKSMETSIEDRVSNFYEVLRNRGFRKDINFTMSESEATEAFGGKDNPNYKMFFEIWKQLKSDIENDKLQIQIDGQKAIAQFQSVEERIKSLKDEYEGKDIDNGNQWSHDKLGDLVHYKDDGTMEVNEGVSSKSAIAFTEQYNQKLTDIKSTLFELLPAYEKIFGDTKYKTSAQIFKARDLAQEIVGNATVKKDKDGKPISFNSSYIDDKGNKQNITGTISLLDRLKKVIDSLFSDGGKKDPIKGISKSITDILSKKPEDRKKGWLELSESFSELADATSNAAGQLGSMFSALGNDDMEDTMEEIQGIASGIGTLGKAGASFASGDIFGGITGSLSGITSIIGTIAGAHDKKLDRAIERSKERVQELELSYKQIEDSLKYNLGNAAEGYFMNTDEVNRVKEAQSTINSIRSKQKLSPFDLMKLQSASNVLKECWATVKYLDENDKENYGNAYNYQRNLYQQQLEQLKQQKADEEGKKKSDQSKINDYNSQIEEMENKITTFSMDLANSLYGIDVKGWADQLGDAIYEAWMKGMSGEEAFEKKSNEIISNLVKSWFKINVVEKAFQNLKNDLFGTDGTSGIFGSDNNISESDINNIASDIMSAQNDVTKSTNKLQEIYERLKARGIDIKNTTDSSSSNVLSGVTEQEANIIAAYLDAIRQDMYNNRTNLQAIIDRGLKMQESPMMQSQLNQLIQIQSNTYKNMELVGEIKSILNDVTLGNKKIYIN